MTSVGFYEFIVISLVLIITFVVPLTVLILLIFMYGKLNQIEKIVKHLLEREE
jgi:hypothetical protein